ncbi:hypothetical protein, partial [Streptomyces sp. Agncl-13]|uniref:hypothetical protein n=1 Tax=Streptomyces sp. Agncl-13 TaxID=3400628 RepID=UPI003A886DAB
MLADDMTAVVNELTTNAVLHALATGQPARRHRVDAVAHADDRGQDANDLALFLLRERLAEVLGTGSCSRKYFRSSMTSAGSSDISEVIFAPRRLTTWSPAPRSWV